MPRKPKSKILPKSSLNTKSSLAPTPIMSKSDKLESTPKAKKFRPLFLTIGIIIIFFLLGSLFYKYRSLFIVAHVNNKPIFSWQLYSVMKKQIGKQVADRLIVEKLILDEAAKKNVSVTEDELNKEIEEIKKNFSADVSLESVLQNQGMTMEDLKKDLRLKILATKIVADKVTVTEEEIKNYLSQNPDFLKEETDKVKKAEEAGKLLKDEKLNQEFVTLIEELKKSSNIQIYI